MRGARTASVNVSEIVLPANFRVPTHDHGPPHIAVVLAGAIRERRGSTLEEFSAGWMRYSPSEDVHVVESLRDGAHVVVVEAFGFPELQLTRRISIGPEHAGLLIEHLREQLFHSPLASPASVEDSALALFTMVRRNASRAQRQPDRWVDEIRDRIASADGARESLDDLAAGCGRHRTMVARAFRAAYGVSIGEHRRRYRLQTAWRLLSDSSVSLAAVALDCGFTDQSHMTRIFRREVGATPATVRARLCGAEPPSSWFASFPLNAPPR